MSWADVPTEKIGCSRVTSSRRLRDWTQADVWPRLHEVLLAELRAAGLQDMGDAAVDGSHASAVKGAHTGPSPVDRARPGSKHHRSPTGTGHLWLSPLTSGNGHDVTQLMPPFDAIPHIRGIRGRPRRRPRRLFADRGYDYDKYRPLPSACGITTKIARKSTAHGSGLGKTRWVVERTFAWLHQFERGPDPLRDTCRPSPRPPSTRLRRHLLETTPDLILK
ncbi:IS5 family transposase [Streptomyces chiangmaiensis]